MTSRMNEYNEGDLIEAVKGESRISGRLTPTGGGDLGIDGTGWPIPSLEREAFTITVVEKAKPKIELPTSFGSGIFWNQGDMKGTRVAMRTGSWGGKMWHYLAPGASCTSEYTDEGIRALVAHYPFTVVGVTS